MAADDKPAESCGLRCQDIETLNSFPLFSGLEPQCLLHVTADAAVLRPGRGEVIFHQGEEARFLHVLLQGQVGLLGGIGDGEETVVEILKPGEIFIPAAVLTRRPYLMAAVALQPCRILALPAERLRRDIRANPDLAVAMLTSLSTYYRSLVREVKDLKLKSAAQRLAMYLTALTPRRHGPAMVHLPHSKGVIAARVGVRAETLSRAFAALKSEGVSVSGSLVNIRDTAHLAGFCNEGDDPV